ncbi:hypothetical protein D3C81_959760 [compost metagenome]
MGPVEGERHKVQLATAGVHFVQLGDGLTVHAQRALGHRDAFRPAGGTRGVDQIGQALLLHATFGGVVGVAAFIEVIDFQAQQALRRRQRAAQTALGQQ